MKVFFKRHIDLEFYNEAKELIAEIKGSSTLGGAKIIVDADFSIKDKISECQINIYDISKTTQANITNAFLVRVFAYYENETPMLIFSGYPIYSTRGQGVDVEVILNVMSNIHYIRQEVRLGNNNIGLASGHTLRQRIELIGTLAKNKDIEWINVDAAYKVDFTQYELNQTFYAVTFPSNILLPQFLDNLFCNTVVGWISYGEHLLLYRKDFDILESKKETNNCYILKSGDYGNIIRIAQAQDEIKSPELNNYFKEKKIKNSTNKVVNIQKEEVTKISNKLGLEVGNKKKTQNITQDKVSTINLSTVFLASAGINFNTIFKLENIQNSYVINPQYKKFFKDIESINGFYKTRRIKYNLNTHGTNDDWSIDLELIAQK